MKRSIIILMSVIAVLVLNAFNAFALEDLKAGILPIVPTLSLKVIASDAGCATDKNVKYIAVLKNVPIIEPTIDTSILPGVTKPIMIDFYTGSPMLPVYPNIYLGSAPIDSTGMATLSVYQKPGRYVGGAIWARISTARVVRSNLVTYVVPPVMKPLLHLDVKVMSPILPLTLDIRPIANVIYSARLFWPIEQPGSNPLDTTLEPAIAPIEEVIAPVEKPLPLPTVIDFYTGKPDVDGFPSKYIGSAKMDKNGVATLRTFQTSGKYSGGAVWMKTPWGEKLLSNVCYYNVPKIILPPIIPDPINMIEPVTTTSGK